MSHRALGVALASGLFAWFSAGSSACVRSRPPAWSIDGLRYGMSRYPTRLVTRAAEPRSAIPFAWMFYLLRRGNRRVVVDTGFVAQRWRERFKVTDYRSPAALLRLVGVAPGEVTDIILTHGHFDHAGGLALFPAAKIHLQEATYRVLLKSPDLPHIGAYLRRARREGRVNVLRGDAKLFSGVSVRHVGGHTAGSQVVIVERGKRRFIIVGDECYLRRLCLGGLPLPARVAHDPKRNRRFLHDLRDSAARGNLVVLPLHDPELLHRHRYTGPDTFRVIGGRAR